MGILEHIFAHKQEEVALRKRAKPLANLMQQAAQATPALDFVAALRQQSCLTDSPALIAEIKRASPSRGRMAAHIDPAHLARLYRENGAAAVSVLTDERFFQGSLQDLRQVRQALPTLPLLRKDFIHDPYQVYEARAAGADALLLIVAGLEPAQLKDLYALSLSLNMTPLVEVHTLEELERTLALSPKLLGINNRNLGDFTVRLETSLSLRPHVPNGTCLVAESGIHTPQDVRRLAAAGLEAILVGEALVTAQDVAARVRSLAWSK